MSGAELHSSAPRQTDSAFGLLLASACLLLGCAGAPVRPVAATPTGPIAAPSPERPAPPPAVFELEGAPFCFAGSNNYYAIYKPHRVVDDLLFAAKSLDLRVLRVWGMLDRGSLDGSVPNVDPGGGDKEGVYFQYWDPAKNAPAYNDGANGLERLDYVLAKANDLGLKIIVVLVNNWRAFGGVDQYLTWYKRTGHDEFFTAPEVKAAYQRWVEHVALRTNSLNGRVYKNDPTIFAWELANEPRATGGAAFDRANGWDEHTITTWADEMSRFIKSIDQQHLVSVGDEGFLNDGGEHWAYRAKDGVDHRALTALPAVDFGTFHLYPDHWSTTPEWGDRWIVDHLRVARELQKPTVLEEFGMKVERGDDKLGPVVAGEPERERAYTRWNELLLGHGGTASLPWMLAGIDEGPGNPRYPDYDGFAFYRDDATGRTIRNIAQKFGRAPACAEQTPSTSAPSPFVRVRRAPEPTAFGWREDAGAR